MNVRAYLFAFALTLFLASLVFTAVHFHRRAKRLRKGGWEGLIGQLLAVDRYKIALIAADSAGVSAHSENAAQAELEPEEIWDLIGGLDGLEALGANCDVLIALACNVQQVYPEAVLVAEQLRLNAREIQWHLARLRDSGRVESLHSAFPHYAQRAVTTYYLMTQSVLALYEHAQVPGYMELQKALSI